MNVGVIVPQGWTGSRPACFEHPRPASWGPTASIHDAVDVPQPIQGPTVPILVGGNGRDVTWRIAARYADELNLDNVPPRRWTMR